MSATDQLRLDYRSGDHPVYFADEMTQSRYHHWIFGSDLAFADVVASLECLLHVVAVEGAGQAFAEQLVDLPRSLGSDFDTAVEMCQIKMEIPLMQY